MISRHEESSPVTSRIPFWTCLGLTICLASASTVFADTRGAEKPKKTPNFRLGNAAAPFGWSTGVGDFDQDGAPDVAIADRLPRHGDRTRFTLQVNLSGGSTQNIRFHSPQPALHLRVTDFDLDGDLDIFFTPALTGSIVAVWANDGAGRFIYQPVDGIRLPESPTSHATSAVPRRGEVDVAVPPSPRDVCHLQAMTFAQPQDHSIAASRLRSRIHQSPAGLLLGPRAPPSTRIF